MYTYFSVECTHTCTLTRVYTHAHLHTRAHIPQVGACTLAAARGLPHASQEEKKALKPQRSGDMLEMILADTPLARLTAQALQAQKVRSGMSKMQ